MIWYSIKNFLRKTNLFSITLHNCRQNSRFFSNGVNVKSSISCNLKNSIKFRIQIKRLKFTKLVFVSIQENSCVPVDQFVLHSSPFSMVVYKYIIDTNLDKRKVFLHLRGILKRSRCKFCTCRIRSLSSSDKIPTFATAGTNDTFKRSRERFYYRDVCMNKSITCCKICSS